jgi:hypothetical protein
MCRSTKRNGITRRARRWLIGLQTRSYEVVRRFHLIAAPVAKLKRMSLRRRNTPGAEIDTIPLICQVYEYREFFAMKEHVHRQRLVLDGIQYLRGIAAMMVVFHHSRDEIGGAMSVTFGARGVEIFFVISGLVMMYSTQGGVLAGGHTFRERAAASMLFWKRRFIRVAPLYWIALLLSAQFVYRVDLTNWTLLKDALFIPHWNAAWPGQIWPTLVPGWSLNY